MTSKERFITTINGGIPDRPPLYLSFTPQSARKVCAHLGIPYEEPIDSMLSTRISHQVMCTHLGSDAVGIAATVPESKPTTVSEEGHITNEWGMVFFDAGLYNEFFSYPLAHAETVDDIESYNFFDPFDKSRFSLATDTIEKYSDKSGIIADLECSIFETSWYLTGLEKFLIDMIMEKPYVDALLEKVEWINTETGKELIRRGADMIWCGDDFGSQQSLILDIETWRKNFKPRIARMFETFRELNPDIKIAWHSCGSIVDLIPDFIDIGLDILNPIQPKAAGMDPVKLKREFGKDLIFFGGICIQELLPFGTPDQIRNEVKYRAEILGENGGYIIAPAHNIQQDTPVENILAFINTVRSL
ncbi:MAG: hypothetical protein JW965_03925 [Bacteroidales bacterium]|nr:hypothetical protein [Bacteroidales bacterium]